MLTLTPEGFVPVCTAVVGLTPVVVEGVLPVVVLMPVVVVTPVEVVSVMAVVVTCVVVVGAMVVSPQAQKNLTS